MKIAGKIYLENTYFNVTLESTRFLKHVHQFPRTTILFRDISFLIKQT